MGIQQKESTANVLYPPEPKQPDNEMFPVEVALRPAFAQREADLANVVGLTTEERATEQKEFTDMIKRSGLDGNVLGRKIYDLHVDARIAQLRGGNDEEQLEGRIQRDGEESRQELAAMLGRAESEKWLALAQKWVKGQPKLHALLGTRGIGSRKDVVVPIIEHLRRIGWKG